MFIYNIKLNGKVIVKILLALMGIVMLILFSISIYKVIKESSKVKDEVKQTDIAYIEAENYTNILKSVHDDIDTYLDQKICFSGYVFRLNDFKETEFVLARNMIINSNLETLIVGFLCNCKEIKNFDDDTWVKITGKITKGNYYGNIPIIEVDKIEKIEKPSNEFVYPPDDSYVPTSAIL